MVDVAALQAVNEALRHGLRQNLVEFEMENSNTDNGAVRDFLGAPWGFRLRETDEKVVA